MPPAETATPTTVIRLASDFLKALSAQTNDSTMPVQQVQLLLSLYLHGEVNQHALTDATGVQRSSNSRNIARLGAGESPDKPGPGYVESFEDPHNRRTKIVRLTAAGRELLMAAASKAARPQAAKLERTTARNMDATSESEWRD